MSEPWILYSLVIYASAVNLTAMAMMVLDKRYARLRKRRIPEKKLMAIASAGGAAGMMVMSFAVRHKTRKNKFRLGLPFLLILHITVLVLLFQNV